MKRYLLALLVIAVITGSLVVQGCAKNTVAGKGKATAVAPANIKAAAPSAIPTNQTALLVSNVALYYSFESSHYPDDYQSMLSQDGGCQMASDYSDAIGTNDLMASVGVYCTSPTPQAGTVNCTQAKADAQKILTNMQSINKLCDTSSDANPYGFGDASMAAALFTAGQNFRTDLGLLSSP
ncbi:MAG: hypothetical protein HY074_17150 [Deltaproteobacteria bacterium]|nr:hypothetical protein [Deltaproteobacteria bacterium]